MRKHRVIGAIGALGTTIALVAAPAATSSAHGRGQHRPDHDIRTGATFTLDGTVLDGGEQVTSVTLDTRDVPGIRSARPAASTFTVHAVGRVPAGIDTGGQATVAYDVDRTVTGVTVLPDGRTRLDLLSGNGVAGAGTLDYLSAPGRNVLMDLQYTVTQTAPVALAPGRTLTLTGLRQTRLVDPEVDAFRSGTSASGLKYRLYAPDHVRGDRPLIVWLHGNGEGGLPDAYGNEAQLRANRGALGFATAEAQKAFGGAYVVAPEVPGTWYDADTAGYRARLKALVDELGRRYDVDTSRIHLAGASAGGLMAVELGAAYPTTFASLVAASPALYLFRTGAYLTTADEVSRLSSTPSWFVQSRDDATVPYDRASVWAHDLLPGSQLTLYDTVTWDGQTYPGHWSWIYLAHDDPRTAQGVPVWTWMSQQHRSTSRPTGHGGHGVHR
ncbi:PHB depolymerase family esterase [Luteimicrobium subarcticum]|uniref:Putative peptidase n=1 Tax=Luteimicrobium subarcticum TaxID=620910 RepID=A0A2M8W1K6_9MICO|nr:PHB depolymerase family esterase [Luteimicrobium subarcticum]PJI84811.1 putative peptidase [Luteimicrobium subarcticum]